MLMTARMTNPAFAVEGAMDALQAVSKSVSRAQLPINRALVHLRASQINGCGVCVDMHAREARQSGESEERVWAVAAWRETRYFSDAERAALALTEALTRLAGPLRAGLRRGLGSRRRALRRDAARRARARHRERQRVEPAEHRHAPDRGRPELVTPTAGSATG